MIAVQIDRLDGDEDPTCVWSGLFPQVPAVGETLEIRPRPGGMPAWYRVLSVNWVAFGQDPEHPGGRYSAPEVMSATLYVRPVEVEEVIPS